jgi:uncharacterized protein
MQNAPIDVVPRPQTWRFMDVVLISVVSVVVTLAASVGLAALRPETLILTLGVLAFEAIGIFAGIYLLGLRRHKWHWDVVGMRPTSVGWVVIAVIAGLFCTVMTGLVTVMVQVALGQIPNNPQLPFLAPGGFSWTAAVGMLVLAGLVVPLAEELLFRGVLYAWLRSRLGIVLSVVISAAIFGLAHGDIPIAVGVAFMGVIQALIYEGSKSIWTTFIMHAINNSLKVLLLYALLAAGAKF